MRRLTVQGAARPTRKDWQKSISGDALHLYSIEMAPRTDNLSEMRIKLFKFLDTQFNETSFEKFVFEYYPARINALTDRRELMSRKMELVDYCERRNLLAELDNNLQLFDLRLYHAYFRPEDDFPSSPLPPISIDDVLVDIIDIDLSVPDLLGDHARPDQLSEAAFVDEISSMSDQLNLANLANFLKAGKWKEADMETRRILLKAANRERAGWLQTKEIKELPQAIVQELDRLWSKHSNGRFGFCAQHEIWIKRPDEVRLPSDSCEWFGEKVGWFIDDWIEDYNQLRFDLEASRGHLPSLRFPALQDEVGWRRDLADNLIQFLTLFEKCFGSSVID